MKKWMLNVATVLKNLGISREKMAAGSLTAEEWKQVTEAYQSTFGKSLAEDKEANEDADPDPKDEPAAVELSPEEREAIANALEVPAETVSAKAAEAAAQAAAAAKAAKAAARQMADEPETKKPVDRVAAKQTNIFGGQHTANFLFGVEHPLYARERWYNQIAVDAAHRVVDINSDIRAEFEAGFKQASKILKERMEQHRAAGTYDALDIKSIVNGTIDFLPPTNELGEYVVRRTDAIIAYFKSLPSVKNLFPVRSNVQNKEAAVSAIIGELSQGYRKGRIFKGGMQFSAGTYKVDDLMFKFNFEDLIDLEKQYIGYLNKDHSAIIKWTFIEWVMVHYGEQLVKEQNERNIIGVRVPQQNVASNPSNLAGDGVIRAIIRSIHEYRVLPFWGIGTYDADTMLDTVEAFADKVQEVSASTENLKIYLNEKHKRWYIRGYREKYGKDADFTGSHATLADLDPSLIIWVPNMRLNDYMMLAAEPGNVELLEDKPGEMLAFEFTPEFEGVLVKSRWKEGSNVEKAGAPFKTQGELVDSNFKYQYIYVNAPMSALTLAATIDVSGNTMFYVSGNTAVTTVNGAAEDRVLAFYASGAGVTIAKSGAFSKIESDFVAGAGGDYLEVYPELENANVTIDGQTVTVTRPTGKFLELGRKVTA